MAFREQPLNRIGGGGAASSISATPLQPWSFASGRLPVLLLCFLAAVVAISSQSLWIDEALTAMKAKQTTLAGWRSAMGVATRGRNGRWTFLVLAAGASPFCWGYLNEARPYAMQLGASFLILAALGRLSESELDRF